MEKIAHNQHLARHLQDASEYRCARQRRGVEAHSDLHVVIDVDSYANDGVGLANIRERLKVLYKGRAELIISVPSTGGTRATIKVPYEIAPATA